MADNYDYESSDDEIEVDEDGHTDKDTPECDLSAYTLFHTGTVGDPCLSFDILQDNLGDDRNCNSPITVYILTGSQGEEVHLNKIQLIKISNLCKVQAEDEDSKETPKPILKNISSNHSGCVNRIRATQFKQQSFAAAWSELGSISIWDLNPFIEALNTNTNGSVSKDNSLSPIFTVKNKGLEGFALDWSTTEPGTFAFGDCERFIQVWCPVEGGQWTMKSPPYSAHSKSVEDIQWSPNEKHVFASCSMDKSLRIWDSRAKPNDACMLTCENAHKGDINVIHWNRMDPFIASGGDDSLVHIWDLRKFQSKTSIATLEYHKGPICSVEWHPKESSVLATGGEDNQILQWDLAVEKDETKNKKENKDLPPELLFVHAGQKELKEIHWHSQIPGLMISTALSGFNIFKTISC